MSQDQIVLTSTTIKCVQSNLSSKSYVMKCMIISCMPLLCFYLFLVPLTIIYRIYYQLSCVICYGGPDIYIVLGCCCCRYHCQCCCFFVSFVTTNLFCLLQLEFKSSYFVKSVQLHLIKCYSHCNKLINNKNEKNQNHCKHFFTHPQETKTNY